MTFSRYRELLAASLEQSYGIEADAYYLGKKYDIVGFSKDSEGRTAEICIVSVGADVQFVRDELDSLPEIMLSGLRSFSRDKESVFLRVFVMEDVPFELIREVRAYKFTKAVKGQFWGYAESQIVLVDVKSGQVYTNLAAEHKRNLFCFA